MIEYLPILKMFRNSAVVTVSSQDLILQPDSMIMLIKLGDAENKGKSILEIKTLPGINFKNFDLSMFRPHKKRWKKVSFQKISKFD